MLDPPALNQQQHQDFEKQPMHREALLQAQSWYSSLAYPFGVPNGVAERGPFHGPLQMPLQSLTLHSQSNLYESQ